MPRRLLSLAFLLQAAVSPAKTTTKLDIAFGPDRLQKLDLYVPSGRQPPLVVFVHGGAWAGGDKSEYADLAGPLAAEGIALAVVNYRLSPEVRHPEHALDLKAALAKLREVAHESGFDDKKIFLLGHSAGAHMLAFAGSRLEVGPIAGYIGLSGIYDLPALVKLRPGYKSWFVAGAFGDDESQWRDASPRFLKPPSPSRYLLIHSVKDELVELAQSESYADYLRTNGAAVSVLTPKSLSHFDTVLDLAKAKSEVTRAVVRFVKGTR